MINISKESFLFKGMLLPEEDNLLQEIKRVLKCNYWREISTPGGKPMSIKITNCGDFGWYSDKNGYRYSQLDPLTGKPWCKIPDLLKYFAQTAADMSGYSNFEPDCCLMNRYEVGSKLSLHQDIDEQDFSQPIVSFSFGLPADFIFGGLSRSDKVKKYTLENGDVFVFGGQDRLRFHGVDKLKSGNSSYKVGNIRINLTFRKSN